MFFRPVQITLENGHVIEKSQVMVGAISNGPDSHPLIATYHNRFEVVTFYYGMLRSNGKRFTEDTRG